MATDKPAINAEAVAAHMHEEMDRADMITATNQLQMDATGVRADRPNWAAYLQYVLCARHAVTGNLCVDHK
jgi:hypothetical protein